MLGVPSFTGLRLVLLNCHLCYSSKPFSAHNRNKLCNFEQTDVASSRFRRSADGAIKTRDNQKEAVEEVNQIVYRLIQSSYG